jgi:hypothetical protein
MRELNKTMADPAASPLVDVLINFKIWFREFRPNADVYIGLSLFRFDGAIRPVGNDRGIPDTLCLGAEVLANYSPDQRRIAVAHEMFHLYHFGFLFEHPQVEDFQAAHMPLAIEGLAVAATESVFPNLPEEIYLHFSPEQLAEQQSNLRASARKFLDVIVSGAPPEYYEQWFTNNSLLAPPRAGYLLGRQVARRLLYSYTFDQLVRMTPAELRQHVERELADIAGVHVMMAAASN